jgi:hypothetical protein
VVALFHLSLRFFSLSIDEVLQLGSSSVPCAFTLPLIHFPPFTRPEFIAFHIPPPAVAAATAAADQGPLDCVHDISQGDHAPSLFICTAFRRLSSHPIAEQQIIPASSLAAAATRATGVSLEGPADSALHLLDLGDALLGKLHVLKFSLWLVNGRYSPAVQQLLLLITATHYLVRADAVTDNALVNCSTAAAPTHSHLPPSCMYLLYIHKHFVNPAPSRYSHSMIPFGRANFSTAFESMGGHYFATLLHRQRPWIHMIPEQTVDDSPSELIEQWSDVAPLLPEVHIQQKLTYRCATGHSEGRKKEEGACHESDEEDKSWVKGINLGLQIMPLENQLVLDRCHHAS